MTDTTSVEVEWYRCVVVIVVVTVFSGGLIAIRTCIRLQQITPQLQKKTLRKATEKYGQEGIYVGRIEHFLKYNRVKNFCITACRKRKKAVIFIVHDQRDTVSVLQFISIMTFFNQLKTVQLSWKMFIGKLFSSIKFWQRSFLYRYNILYQNAIIFKLKLAFNRSEYLYVKQE